MEDSGGLPSGMIFFERGWLSSNSILFTQGKATALVDSGYATHTNQTLALVANALGTRPLDLLVNTHLHSDHCGGNAALQATYPGLRTVIPPGLATAVRQWDPVALSYVPTGQQCPPFSISDVLRPGEQLTLGDREWQVHGAPGHDPHSVVLFEPITRTLIAADALWENGFGVVFPELEGVEAFEEVKATLELVEALAPAKVIPGHGAIFRDVSAALARARGRLDAYLRDPLKHARHAAKVLLKFKLLEVQQVPLRDILHWAEQASYFELVRRRWFPQLTLSDLLTDLIDDLVQAKVAERNSVFIANR